MRRVTLVLALLAAGCEQGIVKPPEAVVEQPWLRVERQATLASGAWLGVVCDTTNGTLLYLYGAGDGRATVVIPGGCK